MSVFGVTQSECGKIRTRITPNTNTFCAVISVFAIHHEGDGRLQRAIEDIINLIEGVTIHSKKQTLILVFFLVKCFL